ncbi:hypothetical protein T492DRAFT_857577 [Pavlovales sp. CCMP2436]|nr:hypothetical protein T492DRAFT_857577 [Pavlovales sp. CCMP2436]
MGALNGFWGRMDTATAEFTGKVNVVEQLAELHGRQRSKFEQRLHEFVEANLAAIANKEKEAREFGEAASTMLAENDSEALAHIATFNAAAKAAKKLFAQRGGSTELDAQRDEAISSLREGNEALHEQLLEIEMMQVDQFIAAIDSFEATYTGMHGTSVEAISITFNALRELATGWTAEALEIASERHDWFVAENLSESDDLADELKAVLNDKEGMEGLTGIEGAAEARLSFLDATEESVAKAEKAAFNAVLNALREGEHRRNRQRVNEVSHLVHTINQELLDKLDKLNNAAEGEEPIIW